MSAPVRPVDQNHPNLRLFECNVGGAGTCNSTVAWYVDDDQGYWSGVMACEAHRPTDAVEVPA